MRPPATRGALWKQPPRGDGRGPEGDDPGDSDEPAPRVMRLRGEVFAPQGRRHGWRRSLATQASRRPMRPPGGAPRGPWAWRRPTRLSRQPWRHHPREAGADRGGSRQLDPRQPPPGRRSPGRPVKAPDVCAGLIHDRVPASISGARGDALPPR